MDYNLAKQRDIELFNNWKNNGDKKSLSDLVTQLHPVIYSEVRRVSGTLPEAALSAEAKKWTIKAIQTYDPSKGTALATHVQNYLPKVRRLNYKFQNAARLPENMHLQFSQFRTATSHLEDSLNREPTDEEVAKELGWSKPQVVKFKGSLYEDLSETGSQRAIETNQFNSNKFLMDHLMSELSEDEKYILLNNKTLSSVQMCEHLGINVPRLNYLKNKLIKKVSSIKTDIRMY